jgi:capsid protein
MFKTVNRIFNTRFGYDALTPRGRRREVSSVVTREDAKVRGSKHRKLQETASELQRNLSLAAWMVRRHLDYVASFKFRSRMLDEDLNRQIETLMEEDSRPNAADVAGRYSREKMFRLAESRRVLDGDVALVKLADMRLQGIQADLIRDPEGNDRKVDEQWINGVQINQVGRPLSFGVYSRRSYAQTEYARRVPAKNVIFYGFFDRYASDQVRGVSPLVAALAPLQDVYENLTYALAKAKVSQLLAMAFFRESGTSIGDISSVVGAGVGPDDDEIDQDVAEPKRYEVDFGGGPQVFNLDPGDRAEFIESKTPSTELQNFTNLVIQIALKALDIPYSFYDESHTNFFGSRAAWMHYERSCKDKRDDQIEMRRQYTVWKIQGWIASGRLVLPAGVRLTDLKWEWVAIGMPWWDPSKEIAGHVAAIKNALDTPQRICRSTGTDYYENVDEIALATEYAKQRGVAVEFAVELAQGAVDLKGDVDDVKPGEDDTDSERDEDTSDTDTERESDEEVKAKSNAAALAIRSGFMTPTPEDEDAFELLQVCPR